ncbi:MAG TPA: hypothetical protein VHW00_19600 [Thermoanaerobaculia bacterium]|nr:hypothetical protein [Thermoanaerobaculia bacterium]
MKYELWYSPSEASAVLLHESDRSSLYFKASDATVIWRIDAATYQEACQKRDEHLDSLRSDFVISSENSTTRFTIAVYLDQNEQEHTVAAPGWVGMLQPLMQERAEIRSVRGQMYVERPGRDASFDMAEFLSHVSTIGVKEITVVDLRSTNGLERMCQEFYGRIDGQERLWYMLHQRLGPELTNWRVVETVIFRGPDPQADAAPVGKV